MKPSSPPPVDLNASRVNQNEVKYPTVNTKDVKTGGATKQQPSLFPNNVSPEKSASRPAEDGQEPLKLEELKELYAPILKNIPAELHEEFCGTDRETFYAAHPELKPSIELN